MSGAHDDEILRLSLENKGPGSIAELVGCSRRTVERVRARLRISNPNSNPPLKPEAVSHIQRLRADGTLVGWTAETVGCTETAVRRHAPSDPRDIREWQEVWADIMRRPALLELHQQFAPKERRR